MKNTYRITFVYSENLSTRTILEASNEEEALGLAFDSLEKRKPFVFENKTHKLFSPIKENLLFVEAELLKKVTSNFDTLKTLLESKKVNENTLKKTFNLSSNDYIAAAFKNNADYFTRNFKDYFAENTYSKIINNIDNKTYTSVETNQAIDFMSNSLKKFLE